jgi:hypothetical protein
MGLRIRLVPMPVPPRRRPRIERAIDIAIVLGLLATGAVLWGGWW